MSLLMKALEKAAKDRVDARTEPAAAPISELALEPLAAEAPGAPLPETTSRQAAAPPARPYAAPAIERAQAASVLQAEAPRPALGGAMAYARTHPVVAIGTLVGVFAVGFGVYVYLQMFHPSLFVAQPPLATRPPVAPLVQAPPAMVVPSPPAPSGALPSAPLLNESAAAEASAAAARARQKPRAAAAAEATPGNAIVVSRGSSEPAMNPLLPHAYAALQAGQLDDAQRAYRQLAAAEPASIDALLGLAAVAVRRGDSNDAIRHYLQVLELDPRNALAQSGLIALLGRADPLAAESKLRQLIAREPSAYLYFTLGNLYADQSQWSAAQQSYFQAHHLDPANPDYAYNLAVGLEHVSQRKQALGFYRRAVELAAARGRANFNLPQAQERIGKLAAQVE